MSPTAHKVRDLLLRQGGFLRDDGRRRAGLIDIEEAQEQVDTYLRYNNLFHAMGTTPSSPDLIYESPGLGDSPAMPCGYIKVLQNPSTEEVAALRLRLWNHGRIPTLWIISPQSVRIYNAFARPIERDGQDWTSHLLGELHVIGDQLTELHNFHRSSFDNGSFWRAGEGRRISANQRVDQALLGDLQDTEALLRDQGLSPTATHALLGRIVFVKYLEDRGVLRSEHFRPYDNATGFAELLSHESSTYTFFAWLHNTFNGDLFPQSHAEWHSVEQRHLDIVRRFLSGHVMRNYPNTQPRLWPYSFNIIPIELISSIYEMFAHAGNPSTAEAQSVHYTRFGLVELILSLTMRDLDDSARVLDPACGSGVFLVEAFRRLVWSKAKRLGRQLSRQELHSVLRSQIFGIDVDKDAVYMAAFSLYLALLEMDPDLRVPDALQFPHLMGSASNGNPRNLYVQDFLNVEHEFNLTSPFKDKGFDLIVSNPPWTAWNARTAPIDPDVRGQGFQWGLRYVRQHNIPDRKPDQAFMWRARDFAGSRSRIAMVVGSRVLHQVSPTGKRWRDQFFETNTVHSIIDLSDLVNEGLLFGSESSTRLPASIIIFSPTPPDPTAELQYVAPKLYPGIRSRDEILLTSADVQILPQRLVREEPFRWKAVFRGTPRDIRLLYKLSTYKTLDVILNEVGSKTGVHRGRGITLGKGDQRDASDFRGLPFLAGNRTNPRFSLDVGELPLFSEPTVAKRSNQLKLTLPSLVLSRSLVNHRPSVALADRVEGLNSLVIAQSYYGISFPQGAAWVANRINTILNSEFALYWTFMTGSELGVGRKLIEVHDWHGVPMPGDILTPNAESWVEALEHELILREHSRLLPMDHSVQQALDRAVYSLYELSEQDIVLIRDTVQHTIDPYLTTTHTRAIRRPSAKQLYDYARRMCSQINAILEYAGERVTATICTFPDETQLRACRFAMRPLQEEAEIEEIRLEGIEPVVQGMSNTLRASVADNLYIQRDLRIYDEDGFWIIKPSEDRLWTEAAALNDADLVVSEHLETARR